MKVFQCTQCNFPVFFENTSCENCGSVLGYLDTENRMIANNVQGTLWLVKGKKV